MIAANILGGSIVIEQVFTLPGLGRLLINAISTRDLPLVQGMVLYIAFIIVIINFLIDIVYTVIDPRIRLAHEDSMDKRSINLRIGIVLISLLFSMMIVSLFYTPFSVTEINREERFSPPSVRHLLGTDNFGRDVLSRIMKASQTAFFVGLVAVSIGTLFGVTIGAVSGYFGGIVDEIIMRFIDAMMAFPAFSLH
jgi:ABC-type dipeptide/oligopeptide/nickel transport system permease subunit